MSTAVQWNIITENPCERVRPPKQTRNTNDVQFFTPEQSEAFLGALDAETKAGIIHLQHNIFFQLALFCGLRRGEAVALLWSDIDLKENTVSITKSTGLVHGKPYTKTTKNHTSVRTIAVPRHIIALLKRYRIEYNTYRMSIGNQWEGGDFLFIQWNGLQMYPSTPYGIFKKILRRYNETHEETLPDIPLHDLRHPYVKPMTKNYFLPSNSCNSSILSRKWHSTGERIFSCFFRYFSYSPCAFSTACLWVTLPFVVKISLLVIFR